MKFPVRAGVELQTCKEEEEYHKRKCFPLRFGGFFNGSYSQRLMKLKYHCKSWRERLKGIEQVKQSGTQDKDIKSLSASRTWYVNRDGLIWHVYVRNSTDGQLNSLYINWNLKPEQSDTPML